MNSIIPLAIGFQILAMAYAVSVMLVLLTSLIGLAVIEAIEALDPHFEF